MDHGATKAGSMIQFCMTYIRNLIQSREMRAVTNARASGDYQPGNDDWDIGMSSIMMHALGLAPSKDNWWSTQFQSGFRERYANESSEPYSRLHSAAASLSNGPVILSDKIGVSDTALILRTCDSRGRLALPVHGHRVHCPQRLKLRGHNMCHALWISVQLCACREPR